MEEDLQKHLDRAKLQSRGIQKMVRKLKNSKNKALDQQIHRLHDDAFEEIDCLDCGNCCKTTSPIFRDVDIKRLARHFRMKDAQFVDDFLMIDNDGDYVLKTAPCPFLDEENYCSVYEHRPKACREYPHTDRKNQQAILDLGLKNTEVCPAVARIFEQLRIQTINPK